MSCGVGRRRGSDPALLWLWSRPAATALIQPLAREPPYAVEVALGKAKRQKNKKQTNKQKKQITKNKKKYSEGGPGEEKRREFIGLVFPPEELILQKGRCRQILRHQARVLMTVVYTRKTT